MSAPTAAKPARRGVLSFSGFVLGAAAAALLFRIFPEIDLWFQRFFWDETKSFFLKDSGFAVFFYKGIRWATPVVAGAAAVIVLHGFAGSSVRTMRWRKPALVLLACIALGSGLMVNVMFKDQWGRARPSQITQFNGVMQFTPPFAIADQCDKNCSFVAGHPSLVFAFFGLAFFAPRRRSLAIGGVAAVGALAGLARIMQGGHFLSDVIFSGVFMFIFAWIAYRLIAPLRWNGGLARPGAPPGPHLLGISSAKLQSVGAETADFLRDLAAIAFARRAPGGPSHLEAMGPRAVTLATVGVVVLCALSVLWIDRPLALSLKANVGGLMRYADAVAQFGRSTMWVAAAAIMGIALWLASRRADGEAHRETYRVGSQRALFFIISVGGAGLAVNLMKILFGRTRPRLLFGEDAYSFKFWEFSADFWSFPSGHTVTAAAVAAAIFFLWPRLVAPFIVLAVLVGLARIVQTAHYASDVLFSIYFAALFTLSTKVWFEQRGYAIFGDIPADRTSSPS